MAHAALIGERLAEILGLWFQQLVGAAVAERAIGRGGVALTLFLGVDTLLLGLALPDDNPHSPNEKFDLACYTTGMRMGAFLWRELSGARV